MSKTQEGTTCFENLDTSSFEIFLHLQAQKYTIVLCYRLLALDSCRGALTLKMVYILHYRLRMLLDSIDNNLIERGRLD
jgi:hypothetical protein